MCIQHVLTFEKQKSTLCPVRIYISKDFEIFAVTAGVCELVSLGYFYKMESFFQNKQRVKVDLFSSFTYSFIYLVIYLFT